MAVKRETVIQALETIQKVAQGISAITPTTVDDEIVKILDLVVTEDWFVDLLMLAIGLLSKPDVDKDKVRAELVKKIAALKKPAK